MLILDCTDADPILMWHKSDPKLGTTLTLTLPVIVAPTLPLTLPMNLTSNSIGVADDTGALEVERSAQRCSDTEGLVAGAHGGQHRGPVRLAA
jgi:hypothetical protein